jgi:uncharacterized membrane protein
MKQGTSWKDENTEQIIGTLLRVGVILSAMVVLAGGIPFLAHYGEIHPNYHVFRGEPAHLRSVMGVARAAVRLDSRAIIQFGLVLLILTPVVRVVFSALAFARERDLTYVIVTLIVLSVLLYSLLGST